jgi:hypothetical protein
MCSLSKAGETLMSTNSWSRLVTKLS